MLLLHTRFPVAAVTNVKVAYPLEWEKNHHLYNQSLSLSLQSTALLEVVGVGCRGRGSGQGGGGTS